MTQKKNLALTLHRETLRTLSTKTLEGVAAAAPQNAGSFQMSCIQC